MIKPCIHEDFSPPVQFIKTMDKYAFDLVRAIAEKKDAIISEAITRHIGPGWNILEMQQGRLTRPTFPDNIDRWELDGNPLVHFASILVESPDNGSNLMTVKQTYRIYDKAIT